MRAFEDWLEDLAHRALPGGVAAAAVAAAMGAALLTKAAGTTLHHRSLSPSDRQGLLALVDLAEEHRQQFLRLAGEDEMAYGQVLQTRMLAADHAGRRQAWQEAIEVPLRLAEACQALLRRSDRLVELCWPAVRTDLRAGRRLLAAGLDAGLGAAEENLGAWGEHLDAQSLRARLDNLGVEGVGDRS